MTLTRMTKACPPHIMNTTGTESNSCKGLVKHIHDSLVIACFQEAKQVYEHVLVVRPRRPVSEDFEQFEEKVKSLAASEYNYTWPPDNEVRPCMYANEKTAQS